MSECAASFPPAPETAAPAVQDAEFAALVSAAQSGQPAAAEALIVHFEAAVYRLQYRILGDATLAEDARQECFIRMLKSLPRYDAARPFPAWLFAIATHAALDLARQRRPDRAITEEDAPALADTPLAADELKPRQNALESALLCLPARMRALLALRFQEDQTPAQIARILDLTPNQVRVELWRARQALRKQLRLTLQKAVPVPSKPHSVNKE